MKTYRYPTPDQWTEITARPVMSTAEVEARVRPILDAVRDRGDVAVREFSERFDGAAPDAVRVTEEEFAAARAALPQNLRDALHRAYENIKRFHEAQREPVTLVETQPGVRCWRRSVPIRRVGIYVPGGTAPLFSSVLMLGVPAAVAGCTEVVMCTPPGRDGTLPHAMCYAAELAGVHQVFKIGGAQAVAAMAYGTEWVPRVYKIFGPGNQYVTAAKQIISREGVAIDLPAGPSEVLVLADDSARVDFVAADLLSQAEHGADSQVVLVTTSEALFDTLPTELQKQLVHLPRRATAEQALSHSRTVLVRDAEAAVALTNAYAPEHLIIASDRAAAWSEDIYHAGSIFLGHLTPESVGDYASGTNHTLPTNGWATAYSGVSLDSFVKKITYQELTADGLRNLGPTVEVMAEAEQLRGHRNAVSIRLESLR
ncbi:MAG: histidinol dehydrogenase [Catalinimonas sp.]